MLELGGDSDHSEEPPWKAARKDDHPKTGKEEEEVIHATRDLVYLEQVINGADKV